jgi:metal-responsive CopG/Arc/MetJ family transcriptional regulator
MTNITLSIEKSIYSKMKKFSEVKWSEFVRRSIKKRIAELEKIEKDRNSEGIFSMITSEDVLLKDWDNKADSRWDNV